MVIKNNEIHIEHPVREGDVLKLNGNQYTTNDLESLEEFHSMWENHGWDGTFEELNFLISELYDIKEEESDG